jgi:hypothetical protein
MLASVARYFAFSLAVALGCFLVLGDSLQDSALTGLLAVCLTCTASLTHELFRASRHASRARAAVVLSSWLMALLVSAAVFLTVGFVLEPSDAGRQQALLAFWIGCGVVVGVGAYAEQVNSPSASPA